MSYGIKKYNMKPKHHLATGVLQYISIQIFLIFIAYSKSMRDNEIKEGAILSVFAIYVCVHMMNIKLKALTILIFKHWRKTRTFNVVVWLCTEWLGLHNNHSLSIYFLVFLLLILDFLVYIYLCTVVRIQYNDFS